MRNLNPTSRDFDPTDGPKDIPQLRPTITQTIELGYSGVTANKVQAGVDLYYTRVTDFIGQLQVITPSVFLNPNETKRYLQEHGYSELEAAIWASIIGNIPLGTVSPQGVRDPTALIAAPRNFGTVDVTGFDLSMEYHLDERLSFAATYSHIDKNLFERLDGGSDFSLNAPRDKGSFTVKYRNAEKGFNAELRNRWIGGFHMISGVYIGDVEEFSLIDVAAGYTIPNFNNMTITFSATNLLDLSDISTGHIFNRLHREFIGAPEIGRLIMMRIVYNI